MRMYILTMTIFLMFTLSKAEGVQSDVLANRLNSDVYFQIHDRQARSDEVSEEYEVTIDKIIEYLGQKPPSDILIPKPEDLDFKPYVGGAQQN